MQPGFKRFLLILSSFISVIFIGIVSGGLFFKRSVLDIFEFNYFQMFLSKIGLKFSPPPPDYFLIVWIGIIILIWLTLTLLIKLIIKGNFIEILTKEGFSFLIFTPAILLYTYGSWYPYPFGHYLLIILLSLFFSIKFLIYPLRANLKRVVLFLDKNSLKILWFLIFLVFFIFLILTFNRYDYGQAGLHDLGNMNQAIWNTLHGNFFRNTNGEMTNRLGGHTDIFLVLLTPFYWLWQSPKLLLLMKCLALALAAWPLFLISKKLLKNNITALIISIAFLISPITQAAFLFEFHSDEFLPFFLFFCFYFILKKKYYLAFIFFIILLTIKEDVALLTFFLGAWIYFKENKRLGILISTTSLIWFLVAVGLIIPHYNGGQPSMFFGYYFSSLGGTPKNITLTLLSRPIFVLSHLFTLPKVAYLLYVFLPLLFIPFLSSLSLVILPFLTYYLLSDVSSMWSGGYHYAVKVLAVVLLAFIFGFKRLNLFIENKYTKPKAKRVLSFIIVMILINFILFGGFFCLKQWGFNGVHLNPFSRPDEHNRKLAEVVQLIPQEVSLAVSMHVGAQTSSRKDIYLYPDSQDPDVLKKVDYVLLETEGYRGLYVSLEEYQKDINMLRSSSSGFTVLYDKNGYLLAKKIKH